VRGGEEVGAGGAGGMDPRRIVDRLGGRDVPALGIKAFGVAYGIVQVAQRAEDGRFLDRRRLGGRSVDPTGIR